MKARIKPALTLTNKQQEAIQRAAEDALAKERAQLMRRFFKMMCFSLNRRYGFGEGRLMAVVQEVSELSFEHAKDEEFWYHLDNAVIDGIGMQFAREDEYEN